MSPRTDLVACLRLMRPAQWPILTAQLAVGMVLALPAGVAAGPAAARAPDWPVLGWAWLAWVVLLNGGTLAFNSAYDRDTGPVAYLRRPPQPPDGLAAVALAIMVLGVVAGLVLVGTFFGLVVAGAVVLSVLYSHPATRWKSRPGLDLAVNVAGYGLGTTLAGLGAGDAVPTGSGWLFAGGFGLLFGSFYPLTQIYQTRADRKRGDRTLTTALGVRRALLLAVGLGLAAGALLVGACHAARLGRSVAWLAGALVLWCGHLGWWFSRHDRWPDARHERAMYHALVLWGLVDLTLVGIWLFGRARG